MPHSITISRSAAAVLAALSLGLAGCTGTGGDSGASGAGGDLNIGFATPVASETYWTAYVEGAKEKAAELGVNVQFSDAKNDANTQLEQVNSLIVAGVDAIILTPVDTQSLLSAPQAAQDAGIPLITSNRALDMEYGGVGGNSPLFHVGFNDVAIGTVQGELVVDLCADKDPCRVGMLLQPLGSTPQLERSQGFKDVIASHPNITVVAEQSDNNDANTAMDVTKTILQQNPDLDVLASQYDPSAVAAAQAVKESGLSDTVQVVGTGGSRDGIAALEADEITGTVWVSPKSDGATALEAMVNVLRGNDISGQLEQINGRPTVPVLLVGVTKENVADHPGEW